MAFQEDKSELLNDCNNKKRDSVHVINDVNTPGQMIVNGGEDSDADLLDILIELSNASDDCFTHRIPSEDSADERRNFDVGRSNPVPVEYFVILEMFGEKLFRYRIDGCDFILNYMKKITKKGNVSFLKMKFDRPSDERLEFDFRDRENANLRRYYILYPLHPNLYDPNRSNISKGLIVLLKNNDRLYWQELSVLPCGSVIYGMKIHKHVTR